MASFRSIFALKPPFTHSSAPRFMKRPCRMKDLPSTAAATALTPRIVAVAMAVERMWRLGEEEDKNE